jgi:hypothetical protein
MTTFNQYFATITDSGAWLFYSDILRVCIKPLILNDHLAWNLTLKTTTKTQIVSSCFGANLIITFGLLNCCTRTVEGSIKHLKKNNLFKSFQFIRGTPWPWRMGLYVTVRILQIFAISLTVHSYKKNTAHSYECLNEMARDQRARWMN